MYAQYENGSFRELAGNVVFSDTVYQTAESLTDEQRAAFSVYNIIDIMPALPAGSAWSESWTYEIDGTDIRRTWIARPKTTSELAAEAAQTREASKAQRAAAVDAIKVTTQAGNTFDGDEVSQGRMARAIIALGTGLAPSVAWVLADNTVIAATPAELTEALVLAGQAQTAVWVI